MEPTQERNWFVIGLIGLVVVAVLVVGGMYAFKMFGGPEEPVTPDATQNPPQTQTPSESAVRITAKHQFRNGTHVVAGEVNVPTPCHVLGTRVDVASDNATQATIHFTTSTQSDGVCAQVITPVQFKVEFKAAQRANLRATWNGQPAILNLVPAGPGENLIDAEVFIKG